MEPVTNGRSSGRTSLPSSAFATPAPRTSATSMSTAAAQRRRRLLADDGEHGLVVELGVVEPIEEVDGTRTRRRHTDTQVARELGVRARHERRHLLVTDLDELRVVGGRVESAQDGVDA